MEKFAIGISIGAALTSSFHSILSTSEDKIQDLSARVKNLGEQKIAVENVKSYRAELAHLTASIKPGTAASAELKAKIDTVRTSLKNAQTAARALGVDTRHLGAEEKRLAANLAKSNRALKTRTKLAANKAARQQLHSEFIGAAASLGAVVVPVKTAIGFESSMADVGKVVDLQEPGGIKALGKDILDLTTKIPMAYDGIASIVEAAGQSGMAKTRKELVDFAATAATMGVAFDLSGNDAGEMMTAWRAGMKLTQDQAVSLADAVNYVSNNMNAKAGPLGEVLQRQGAVAVSAGLTEVQAASLGAALLSSGKGPEIAATAMKNLTGALTRGTAATGAQKKAFQALGFDAVEMAAMMQKDAAGAIKQVFAALSEASPEEQNSLAMQIFGQESLGVIMPLLTNLDNLEKAFALTADKTKYAGSMQKEYEVRSKTTAFNLQRLRNQVTKAGINLGTTLLPALNASLGPIGAVADKVGKFSETFPGATAAITMGTAAFLLAKPAMFAVRYGATMVSDAIEMGKAAFGAASTAVQWTTAQLGGLNIAQRASAAGAKIAAGAQWLWNTSLSAGAFVLAKARVIALGAAQAGVAVGTKVLAAAQIALGAAMNIALGPVGLIIGAVAAFAGLAVLVWKKWEPIKAFFAGVWKSVANGAAKLWGALKTGVKASFGVIKAVFMNFTPLGWIIKGFTAVKNYLGTVDWSSPGKAIMGTLVAGIKAVALGPVEAVKGVFAKVRKFLPFSDAKEGPLSTLTASGAALVTTFAQGMESGKKGLTKKAATVAAAAGIAIAPMMASAGHDVPAAPPAVADSVKTVSLPTASVPTASLTDIKAKAGYEVVSPGTAVLPDIRGKAGYDVTLPLMPGAGVLADISGKARYEAVLPNASLPGITASARYEVEPPRAASLTDIRAKAGYEVVPPGVVGLPDIRGKAGYDVTLPLMPGAGVLPDIAGKARYEAVLPNTNASLPAVSVPKIAAVPPSQSTGLPNIPEARPERRGLVINYNPVIHVDAGAGQAEGIRQDTQKALDMSQDRLRRMMQDLLDQDRRLSYV